MAAEYGAPLAQTVNGGQPVLFPNTIIPGVQGLIFKQNGDGVILLASQVNTSVRCCNRTIYNTLYKVEFNGNIAIPTGGTVEEIGLAITVDGEPVQTSYMLSTPGAAAQYNNVSTSILVPVPSVCKCANISVRNITASGAAILVQNANLVITPAGIQIAS